MLMKNNVLMLLLFERSLISPGQSRESVFFYKVPVRILIGDGAALGLV